MKVSSTAYGAAFLRAAENLLPEDKRLFKDSYSGKFLSPFWKIFVILMCSPKMRRIDSKSLEMQYKKV